MNYSLWIDGKSQGPYDIEQIRQMLKNGAITPMTLFLPEGSSNNEWLSVFNLPFLYASPKTDGVHSVQSLSSATSARHVGRPVIASALGVIAILEFVAAPMAGIAVGANSVSMGLVAFLSAIISGIFLLGFAQVIEYLYETADRLRRIESLLERNHGHKDNAS